MATPVPFFGGKISQNYEDYLGPFLFEPYAVDFASRIDFNGVSQILELACGSGRLSRHIAAALPPDVAFTATDLSNDMITVAQDKVPNDQIKWMPADMLDLPFDDGSFDLVVCQFGLMIVPDHQKALSEIFRVLKRGGKIMFNAWSDLSYNKIWAIGDKVLKSLLGKSPMDQDPGPFALGAKDDVLNMLTRTGFSNMQAALVTNIGETGSSKMAAYGFIYGLPIALFIQKEDPDLLETILQTLDENLKTELGDQPLRAPQKALVFEAIK